MNTTNLLKKIVYAISICVLITSCHQEFISQESSKTYISEQIGEMHNSGLAFILNEMDYYRLNNLLNGTTQEDIIYVANKLLSSFSITKAGKQINGQDLLSDSITINNLAIATSLDSAITSEFLNAFKECSSEKEIKEKLLLLRDKLCFSQTDSLLLSSYDSGIAVALASLDYWKDNYQKWYNTTHILQESPATKSGVIHGRVLDENQEPIIGASIQIQGTTYGVVTDTDGNFSLNIPAGHDTIVVSYIGYETATIALSGRTSIVITLSEDAQSLWDTIAPVASADGIAAISTSVTCLALGPFDLPGVAVGAIVGSLSYCLQQVLP